MARQYAPIYTQIWHDQDFIALPEPAQRLYFLANSQADISYCGVVSFTPQRWSKLSSNSTPTKVRQAAAALAAGGFVMVDPETEELWVRGFVKHNKILSQGQLKTAMRRAFPTIHSPAIRAAFLASLPPSERAACGQPAGSLPSGCPPSGDTGLLVGTEVDLDTEPSSSSPSGHLSVVPKADEEDEEFSPALRAAARKKRLDYEARGGVVGSIVAFERKCAQDLLAGGWREPEPEREPCAHCSGGNVVTDLPDGDCIVSRCVYCTQGATA